MYETHKVAHVISLEWAEKISKFLEVGFEVSDGKYIHLEDEKEPIPDQGK